MNALASSSKKRTASPQPEVASKRRSLRPTRAVDYRLVKPEPEEEDELEEKPAVRRRQVVVKKEEGEVSRERGVSNANNDVHSVQNVQSVPVQTIPVQTIERALLDCVMITLDSKRSRHFPADENPNIIPPVADLPVANLPAVNDADEIDDEGSEFIGENEDENEEDGEEEEEDDFDYVVPPDFVPVPVYAKRYITVQAPLRTIQIKGSGITDKDKDEIAATLGELELVTVPGIEGQMYMARKHLDQYFYWCAERQKIFEKRERGEAAPWTDDDLFYARTSNVFRHQDRTSQFLIKHVIDGYKTDPPPPGDNSDPRWKDGVWMDTIEEACWRVMVLWQFGKMETWEVLRKGLPGGDVRWATYNEEVYTKILGDAVKTGFKLFTGSYQIHPDKRYGGRFNYVNAMRSISHLMRERIPHFYTVTTCLEEAWNKIQTYWGIGHYHGLQLTLHLNYIRGIALSTTDWICNGRGAKNGLSLILPELSMHDRQQLKGMKWLLSQQWDQWKRLGFTPTSGFSNAGFSAPVPGVSLVDIENSLCLWQKYQRDSRKRELTLRQGGVVVKNVDQSALRMGAVVEKCVLPLKFQIKLEAVEAEDFVELGRAAFGNPLLEVVVKVEDVQVKLEEGVESVGVVVAAEESVIVVAEESVVAVVEESVVAVAEGSGSDNIPNTNTNTTSSADEASPPTPSPSSQLSSALSSVLSSALSSAPDLHSPINSLSKGKGKGKEIEIIDVDAWDVIILD